MDYYAFNEKPKDKLSSGEVSVEQSWTQMIEHGFCPQRMGPSNFGGELFSADMSNR